MPDDTPIRDTVYFYKFNNYYNRIIKRYDTIVEYGEYIAKQENCNFVHGDGINSSFTFNKALNVNDTPDYVIVSDYKGNLSRWFVTNSFKNRDRQDSLTLRRDLIADYYDDVVKHSPCLIRKGYVPQTNPLIFNDEGVQYNKIKESEIEIKDNSNCSYIVGFIANNTPAQATINGTIKEENYDYYYASINDFPLKAYVDGAGNTHTQTATQLKGTKNLNIYYAVKYSVKNLAQGGNVFYNFEMTMNYYGYAHPSWYTNSYSTGTQYDSNLYYNYSNTRASNVEVDYNITGYPTGYETVGATYRSCCKDTAQAFQSTGLQLEAVSLLGIEETQYNDLMQYNGKKIKLGNVVYNCSISSPTNEQNKTITANSTLISYLNASKPLPSMVTNMLPATWQTKYNDSYNYFAVTDVKVLGTTQDFYLQLSEASTEIKTSLDSPSNRTHLDNQPFDMFVLINESGVNYKVGTTDFVSDHDVNMNIAQAICQASGTSAYDIQIVPFNPIQGSILADGTINWLNYDVHAITNAGGNETKGHYVMCSSADIKLLLNKDELKIKPDDYKKDYNLKQYRLCSPNQETAFDFSPSMNDGIDTWEVTANYRPYASYIKVQPTWNWMYGENYYNNKTDFRGLVYNSTLCVTQLNDAWSNYVSNNKNFQQLFDNQINTLTKQNEIQIGAMEETLGLRSFTGMPISSVLRVIGGMKDIEMNKELNNLALSKMQSDFGYQMDNIKSMPHTIKKLTNINGDTRNFPYIEVYGCSGAEEESFNLKMQYTGYTIMTTGYIENYLKPSGETFIQADLIRLDLSRSEETADNHMAVEIANELGKGLYIIKEE